MLSDEDIAGTFDSFGWSFGEDSSMYVPVGRAIESAACGERDARIAELTRELAEARKQTEAQKDEWLSWEAKRRDLEADAGRWREWEQGRGLTVVVPTPTDDKPDRKVTIIYSPNPYPAYPTAVRKAIDAAIKEQT